MSASKFEVRVPIEPMSGTKGKRKYARKKDLFDAIIRLKGDELRQGREALKGKRVAISIEFFLWKSDKTHTNTTSRKDIDNLLKLVLDALQTKVDSQGKMEGLGLIENDNDIYRIEATKQIVEPRSEVGLHLQLSEYTA